MLNKLIRFYNTNKKEIIIISAIIIFIFIIVQTINVYMEKQTQENVKKITNTTLQEGDKLQTDGVIDKGNITANQAKKNEQIIKKFVEACNKGKIEEAYEMLTDSCKITVFPTIEEFKNNYQTTIFNQNRDYMLQLWMTDTSGTIYKIEYLEDLLASGGKKENSIVDYITIVEDKININTFIETQKKKIEINKENIKVSITRIDYYTEYQDYTIALTNSTEQSISWYSDTQKSSWYLVDENNNTYFSNVSKFTTKDLTIGVGEERTLKVRFYKLYNNTEIKKMVFKNIVTNTNPVQLVEIEINT